MIPNNSSKRKLELSFTIIELLVVIALIGLLASIILVSLRGARDRAKTAQTYAALDGIRKVILLYYQDYNGKLPPDGAMSHCWDASGGWDIPDPNTCNCVKTKLGDPISVYTITNISMKDAWGTCYIWHYHPDSSEYNFLMSLGSNKTGDWWSEHSGTCDDDDICLFFGTGTQAYHPGQSSWK